MLVKIVNVCSEIYMCTSVQELVSKIYNYTKGLHTTVPTESVLVESYP